MTPSRRHARRVAAATFVSVLLSIVVATSVLALFWGTARRLTSSGESWAQPHSVAATGEGGAVVVYQEGLESVSSVYARRTTDAGVTWLARVRLSPADAGNAYFPAVAASGNSVDAVWSQGPNCPMDCRVYHRRSIDGGGTWTVARAISGLATTDGAWTARVARRGQQVTVTWSTSESARIRARTSLDGGSTWGPLQTIGTHTNPFHPSGDAQATVTIGSGVTYVVFYRDHPRIVVRRSLDQGATWQPPILLATAFNGFDVVASGSRAIVAYGAGAGATGSVWVAERHTADAGVTWSPAAAISPPTANESLFPSLAYRAGRWVATFARSLDPELTDISDARAAGFVETPSLAVFLRESTNGGSTWGTTFRASPASIVSAYPSGSAIAGGRHLVAFVGMPDETTASYVYVRPGFWSCAACDEAGAR